MHEVDGSFKQAKLRSARRRRQRRQRRLLGAILLVAFCGAVGLSIVYWPLLSGWIGGEVTGPLPLPPEMEAQPVFIPAIVDLAGDPMRISLGDDVALEQRTRLLPRPTDLPAERVPGEVAVLTDTMISSSRRFMTTLPSSPSDFAFYQSQRKSEPLQPSQSSSAEGAPTAVPAPMAETIIVAEGAGWGDELETDAQPLPTVERTSVENTTSVAFVRSEVRRFKPDSDLFVRILVKRSIASLFDENGLPAAQAEGFEQAMIALMSKTDFNVDDVVAVRTNKPTQTGPPQIVQMSIYTSTSYLGTLALSDDGNIVLGADPWVPDDLFNYRGQESVAEPGRQYRLLDAIYSTAVRNRVPTGVLGEAIMLLSRRFDLNAFASADDRLVLAYAREGDDAGRVLYAAVKGTDRDMECYVFRVRQNDEFSCFSQGDASPSGPTLNGITPPVKGVLTSKFGPRTHPIFHDVRVHTGVDWAAPSGTPVTAALAGEIISAAPGGGYGNLLRIGHGGGKETWYAHLQAFAEGMVAGKSVAAGDLVGYVGTTGNSTGPHLHFELRLAGEAVDPLQAPPTFVTASGAVEGLTERIVQVESGGVADARNPLSTATGAGQFIQSTWLRMMRTYRPDLAAAMSEADLLTLRNDPTIAREMVQNLAREGEAYLKARGHGITAGRLYLAHFLGMEDAHRVLSSPGTLSLDILLTPAVMNANPFLKGHDVAYVIGWAEKKMGSVPIVSAPTPTSQPQSPEFELYKAAISEMLAPKATAALER